MAPVGKGACRPVALSHRRGGAGASCSRGTALGRQAVEAFLFWVETVTQISGNWDRKVPRGPCLGRLQKVSPHFMFL